MNIKGNVQLIEACLKETSNFSHVVVHNICTGTQHIVPLGFWDYTPALFLSALLCVVLALGVLIVIER